MIQEQLKVFNKCLFINPVGGAAPSGTVVLSSRRYIAQDQFRAASKFIFTLLKFHAQNYKDINAALGMLGRLKENGKGDPKMGSSRHQLSSRLIK